MIEIICGINMNIHPFQSFIEKHECAKRKCTEKQLLFCIENNVCLEDSIPAQIVDIKNELMVIDEGGI